MPKIKNKNEHFSIPCRNETSAHLLGLFSIGYIAIGKGIAKISATS